MRRSLSIAAITVALLAASPAQSSGIPTFDGANVSQALAQLLQMKLTHGVEEGQLDKLGEQVRETIKTVSALQRQIDQLERQYESLTGSRGMGGCQYTRRHQRQLARRRASDLEPAHRTDRRSPRNLSNPGCR